MKLRKVISMLMLSVYLTSVCGYALTIILCHCPHSQHYKEHHCVCAQCGHTHIDGDGIKADDRCDCKHNHTTEISLYDIAKHTSVVVTPVVSDCIVKTIDERDRLFASVERQLTEQRKVPLPSSPFSPLHALRAPPVLA